MARVIRPRSQQAVLERVARLLVPIHGQHGVLVLLRVRTGPKNEVRVFGETLVAVEQAVQLARKAGAVVMEGILLFELMLSVSKHSKI